MAVRESYRSARQIIAGRSFVFWLKAVNGVRAFYSSGHNDLQTVAFESSADDPVAVRDDGEEELKKVHTLL